METTSDRSRDKVLFVCTGNVCRSPMAAAMLNASIETNNLPIEVRSAGFQTRASPPSTETVNVMKKIGLDVSSHRSSKVAETLAEHGPFDLILVMERQHVRSLTDMDPSLFKRTFTLPEFARLSRKHGARGSQESLQAFIERLSSDRSPADLMGIEKKDELEDPIGRSRRFHMQCARQIEAVLNDIVKVTWP